MNQPEEVLQEVTNMPDILSKIRPKASRFARRVVDRMTSPPPADPKDMQRLSELLGQSPAKNPELESWATDVQVLLNKLVMQRLSREDISTILTALVSYRQTGITPASTQMAFVRAYENSAGLFQETLHRALFGKFIDPGTALHSGLFGDVGPDVVENTVSQIRTGGYAVLPFRVSPEIVSAIKQESLSFPYRLKGDSPDQSGNVVGINLAAPPPCVSAYANANSVANSARLKAIADDQFFVRVASKYLETPATAIDATLWYTFPHHSPSSETAQLFHYDLDTVRWIKVFIYLTDVGPKNGPHEYVSTSHRAENKPSEIMVKNYARIDDAEVDRVYPGKRISLAGPAGTVIIGDTRCLHKGNAVELDHRLIYSPIFAPSKIGYVHG